MKTMTKLLIALPTIALISACSTSSPRANSNNGVIVPEYNQTMTPQPYSCDNNGSITVNYANSSVTRLDATMPELSLNNQRINLYREVSGSGERYVDSLNPNFTITWHTKGDEALFAVDWANGKSYQTVCNKI